jgi:hypothetical protein
LSALGGRSGSGGSGGGGGAKDQETAFLLFATDRAALEAHRAQIVAAGSSGRLTWVSYPKAGKLRTDLNRDSLAALLAENGVQPVRQIAVDDVWPALRFKPA